MNALLALIYISYAQHDQQLFWDIHSNQLGGRYHVEARYRFDSLVL